MTLDERAEAIVAHFCQVAREHIGPLQHYDRSELVAYTRLVLMAVREDAEKAMADKLAQAARSIVLTEGRK